MGRSHDREGQVVVEEEAEEVEEVDGEGGRRGKAPLEEPRLPVLPAR